MWAWELASGWLRAPIEEVATVGLDLGHLDRWHALVATIEPRHDDGTLPTTGTAVVRLGGRDVRAHWRRRGGRGAVAHLTLADAHDDPLDIDLVFAPWNGGTVVELGAAGTRFGGRRLHRRGLHRALDRSLRDLAGTVARPLERPPVVPRPRGLARTDVAPA